MNDKIKYDFLVVGSGFFGATIARKLTDAGKTCLVIDKNEFLGGAAHDFRWTNGQLVAGAGAHIFHTHSEEVWQFTNQFCSMEPFINKPKVLSGNKVYSFPINMMTLHQLWGVVTPAEARQKLNSVRIPCEKPRNFEEWALDKIGRELYELFIYGYTKKQYMKEPSELPSSIIQRLPIRLTYEENYFTTKYQGMPSEGYSALIENMLSGIDVRLGVDFFTLDWQNYAKHLIYTGPVDKFFDFCFGKLDYNTLRFEHKEFRGDYQGNAVFNHVDANVPYLRSIEHKHFLRSYQKHYDPNQENQNISVVSFDYPISFEDHPEPYYPIRDEKNSFLYDKYFSLKKTLSNVTFGGRLGEYKYLDLDQTMASAMQKAKNILQ
jgi:UDP-galactopyranose mutase